MSLTNKHLFAALIWCALFGIAYLLIDQQMAPKVAMATTETEIVVPRSRDGHFYVAGFINGQPIDFMVDTGASTTSISADVARQIGLPPGRQVTVHTANGTTQGEEIPGQTLTLGGITINRVRIIVLPKLQGHALLGQNVLKHLEVMQSAGEMKLRAADRKPL